jgi:hypothetical protein
MRIATQEVTFVGLMILGAVLLLIVIAVAVFPERHDGGPRQPKHL